MASQPSPRGPSDGTCDISAMVERAESGAMPRSEPEPARHEVGEVDAAALEAARAADALLRVAREMESERWTRYLAPLPERLRDDPIRDLRGAARLARAAYGPKDSIRDTLPEEVTEPFLDRIDRLIRAINRWEANRA